MTEYDGFEPNRIKHLELIQAVVGRLGNDGFLMKGWAVTISGAFIAFAVNTHNRWLAAVALLPAAAFWGLDAYFLRCERLFRVLYRKVKDKDDAETGPFYMSATHPDFIASLSAEEQAGLSLWRTLRRPALFWFYLLLFVVAVGTLILTHPAAAAVPPLHHRWHP